MARIFIDGQAGTTGLELSERLGRRDDLCLLQIDAAERKDPDARRRLMEAADITVLCLPDAAAREAAEFASGRCRVLDASTAHRVTPGWTYGCPELSGEQRQLIAAADRVTNPGCYPQGFILMTKPLIEAGLLPAALPLSVFGLSGYSGGGHTLIEAHESFNPEQREAWNTRPYSLTLAHKHVPEMHRYSGTAQAPLFVPSVGDFFRGMLIQVPLFTSQLRPGTTIDDVHSTLTRRYRNEGFVQVLPRDPAAVLDNGFLNATDCNRTNNLQIMTFGHDEQILLIARYDNLGKGAAGAAMQNLNIMLGAEESLGLAS